MRAIMISVVIIFFCLSCELMNEMDSTHQDETGRSLFNIHPTYTGLQRDNLPEISDSDSYNASLYSLTTPNEQPESSGITSIFSTLTFVIDFVKFLVNVAFNSTLNFIFWLPTLGTGVQIIPTNVAHAIAIGVYLNYLYCVAQIITGRSLLDGA